MNPMLPVYSGLSFLITLRYYLAFFCPLSNEPFVASISGFSCFITPWAFSTIDLSCVLCILCCQFLWILMFHYPLGILYHLFVLCLVYPLLLVYLDCPLSLPLRCSLTCICPASYVSYAASFSGLSLCIVLYVLFNLYLSCVLLTLCCQVFWIVPFIAPSVFSNIYMSCVLCSLCCQFLWIVLFHCTFGIL